MFSCPSIIVGVIFIFFGSGTSMVAGGQTFASQILTMSGQAMVLDTIVTFHSTR